MHGNHLIVMNRKTNPVPNNNNNNFNIKSIKQILKNILWIQIIHASVVLLQKKKFLRTFLNRIFPALLKIEKYIHYNAQQNKGILIKLVDMQ